MSRVNYSEQYERHQALSILWCDPVLITFFGLLEVSAQWRLHELYKPSEDIDEAEFIEHCRKIKKSNPGLFNIAGKYYKIITKHHFVVIEKYGKNQEIISNYVNYVVNIKNKIKGGAAWKDKNGKYDKRRHSISVVAIAKPIDVEKLARAFLKMAEYCQENNIDLQKRK